MVNNKNTEVTLEKVSTLEELTMQLERLLYQHVLIDTCRSIIPAIWRTFVALPLKSSLPRFGAFHNEVLTSR